MNMSDTSKESVLKRYWPWLAVFVIVMSVGFVRIRLLSVPLERDEGEYAYAGQLMLQGVAPYVKAYNMKFPGIYAVYAVLMAVFGQSVVGIHTGLMLVNAASVIVLFLIGRRVLGNVGAIISAFTFALMSVGQPVQGVFANAEHFVILPALLGVLFLLDAHESDKRWKLFLAGLFFGVGFVIKQHGAAFVLFGALYSLLEAFKKYPDTKRRAAQDCGLVLLGASVPFLAVCLVLAMCGVFDKFWFWTFTYASRYASSMSLRQGVTTFIQRWPFISGPSIFFWELSAFGLLAALKDKQLRPYRAFIFLFAFCSVLAVCPGFYFRPHYFILLLPAVGLLVASVITGLYRLFGRGRSDSAEPARTERVMAVTGVVLPLALLLAASSHAIFVQSEFLLKMTPRDASRGTYGANPFPESLEIARFIRQNSAEEDTVAVIGSEPQIYFYSGRRSATGYIYTYALMEDHEFALQMQEEMIREVEESAPRFLVTVSISTSWLATSKSNMRIFEWLNEYAFANYERVGVIDIISIDETVYVWGEDSVQYSPQSEYWMSVLQRKENDETQ